MLKEKYFQKIHEKTRDDGVKVIKYKPKVDMYITSINPETGEIKKNKIIMYSEHFNLKFFKLSTKLEEFKFEPFYVSADHSLLVYDRNRDEIRKMKPGEVILYNDGNLFLMKKINENDEIIIPQFVMNSKYYRSFTENKILLIPFDIIDIEESETINTGYDFTVENDYTFMTEDGVFVQDTMAIYLPLTKEDQEMAKKLLYSNKIYGSAKYKKPAIAIKAEEILGIYLLTKRPGD